jgi:hypothetical protein
MQSEQNDERLKSLRSELLEIECTIGTVIDAINIGPDIYGSALQKAHEKVGVLTDRLDRLGY